MRVESISLNNIRSHKESSIELQPGITVLTGKTGSGKSTFLMAIEFALFGSSSAVSNAALLRRGEKKGHVSVTFREGDDNYTIIRSLKRTKNGVRTDHDNLKLIKNGKEIVLAGRDSDITEYVCKILDYRVKNPKNLFEVTSYCRQDEIRQIIIMSAEKRQEFIDKILRLSKYNNTWKNMKYGIDYLNSKLEGLKTVSAEIENLESEIIGLEMKINETKKKLDSNLREKNMFSKKYEKISLELKNCESSLEELKDKRDKFLNLKANLNKVKSEIIQVSQSKERIEGEISNLLKKRKELGDEKGIRDIKEKIGRVNGEISLTELEYKKLQEEIEEIKKLKAGKCPKCKQPITEEHLYLLENEYKKKFEVINKKINELREKQKFLKKLEERAEQIERIGKEVEKNDTLLSELKNRLSRIVNEKNVLHTELRKYENIEEEYTKNNERLKNLNQEISRISSKISSLNSEISLYEKGIKENEETLSRYKNKLSELEKSRRKIIKIENANVLLTNLREDIRKIRETIRGKFLEEFRNEFQKKFEEIRAEGEYVVDIKPSYEPVAFSSNKEEVSIDHLSGGEKTSVALAYRLALANIAAQMASTHPSEILILDEPTVGLDKDDIRTLPDLLRSIQTIPQIVIVSHEENLKQAADYRYSVMKDKTMSKVIPS